MLATNLENDDVMKFIFSQNKDGTRKISAKDFIFYSEHNVVANKHIFMIQFFVCICL